MPFQRQIELLGSACTINFRSLFLAGTDTTALTLSWTMYYLVKYPEAFARCRAEAFRAAPARCGLVVYLSVYHDQHALWSVLAATPFQKTMSMQLLRRLIQDSRCCCNALARVDVVYRCACYTPSGAAGMCGDAHPSTIFLVSECDRIYAQDEPR